MQSSPMRRPAYNLPPVTPVPKFSSGERVRRVMDGAPGVVRETGREGNIWVVWDASGLTTVVKARQLERE